MPVRSDSSTRPCLTKYMARPRSPSIRMTSPGWYMLCVSTCRMSSRKRSPAYLKKGTALIITELVSRATWQRRDARLRDLSGLLGAAAAISTRTAERAARKADLLELYL